MNSARCLFIFGVCLLFAGCKSVSMSDRELTRADIIPGVCDAAGVEWLDRKIHKTRVGIDNYNSEMVANEFALFGVASENAYAEVSGDEKLAGEARRGAMHGFLVENYDPRWELQARRRFENGLSFDVYYNRGKDEAELPSGAIMLAIRGTENAADWIYGNIPGVASLFPQETQFETLRREFQKMLAQKTEGQKRPYVFATGHSLGGALARHLAEAYPCTSAVVFDTSPVTLASTLKPRVLGGLIVDIVERNDELRVLAGLFADFSRENDYVKFTLNPISTGALQHAATGFAAALPRYVLDCRTRGDGCEIKASDPGVARAKAVYCEQPKGYGVNDSVCP